MWCLCSSQYLCDLVLCPGRLVPFYWRSFLYYETVYHVTEYYLLTSLHKMRVYNIYEGINMFCTKTMFIENFILIFVIMLPRHECGRLLWGWSFFFILFLATKNCWNNKIKPSFIGELSLLLTIFFFINNNLKSHVSMLHSLSPE